MAPTPTNLHLYSTPGSPATNDAWKCLTCKFPNCTYQETKVQSSFEHILIHCKGPTHHHFYLADIVKGEAENWQEILYSQEYEDNVGSVRLPYVISEVVPLGQGFGME
ncbi:unnamed protein product [Cylicostephanus goldi]|uniref:Uncharacterized protein n=1 Tax=Cylicostephanus goldi TaxID=71465 RepID=A0A3P6S8M5_CYLGO|nr:unnamed protein product [Cylicostephanus goldi]